MGKRVPYTPTSIIKNHLRQLWLRSRERASALKRDNYSCTECGKKQSKAKGREVFVQVHHVDNINWEQVIAYIRKHLLCDKNKLKTLCDSCHNEVTERNNENKPQ